MGKGGGCFPSKNRLVVAESSPEPEQESQNLVTEVSEPVVPVSKKLRIFIVFYSMYGHVESLARRMKKGVDGIDGVEAVLYRVPETLEKEVLEKMKVPVKDDGIPVISAAELMEADGILFGFPTRYGCMAAQMKAFFDSTGGLWSEQKLSGKPAGFFVGTGTQGGGQETTACSMLLRLGLKEYQGKYMATVVKKLSPQPHSLTNGLDSSS